MFFHTRTFLIKYIYSKEVLTYFIVFKWGNASVFLVASSKVRASFVKNKKSVLTNPKVAFIF